MPYVWVEPEKFMSAEETEDVDVYHCHDQGCLMTHHYQVRSDMSETAWMAFDIRDLKYKLGLPARTEHKSIIKAALDKYGPPLEEVIDMLIDWYEGETEGTPT